MVSEPMTLVEMFDRIDGYFSRDIRPHGLCDDLRAALAAADARAGEPRWPWRDADGRAVTVGDWVEGEANSAARVVGVYVMAWPEFGGPGDPMLEIDYGGPAYRYADKCRLVRYEVHEAFLAYDATLPAAGTADVAATDEEGGHREHA